MTTSRISLLLGGAPLAAAVALAAAGCGTTSSKATPATAPAKTPATTAAAAKPTASAAVAAPASRTIAVTLNEWRIAATPDVGKAGAVTFNAHNSGKEPHELVVLRTPKPAASLGTAGEARVAETGHVGEVEDLPPGGSGHVTLHLKPGHYALICNMAGHWASGMRTDFTVR